MGDEEEFVDPAVFLFTNSKYHDCTVNVCDQDKNEIEKIGVASSHLISSSSVFRKLLENNATSITINNISPAVFKLMLTHMYGGKLAAVDPATTAQLALAASQYNLQHLVRKACKRLVPTCVDDVFFALICVAHINNSQLLPHVSKIIQEQTGLLVSKANFMMLDLKCLQWIASQEQLAITELELWNAVVKWAENKAKEYRNKPTREIMQPLLPYIRLATLNKDEFIAQIMPADVLSDSEVVQVLKTLTTNTALVSPDLCVNPTPRIIFRDRLAEDVENISASEGYITRCLTSTREGAYFKELGQDAHSHFRIKPKNKIEIKSISVQGLKKPNHLQTTSFYQNQYNVIFKESDKNGKTNHYSIENVVMCKYDEEISLPIKLQKENDVDAPFLLDPTHDYDVTIHFYSSIHPVCLLADKIGGVAKIEFDELTITCEQPCHLRKISYSFEHDQPCHLGEIVEEEC